MKRQVFIWLALALCVLVAGAFAGEAELACQIGENVNAFTYAEQIGGNVYLFLPAYARTEPLTLHVPDGYTLSVSGNGGQEVPVTEGEPFALSMTPERDEYTLLLTQPDGEAETVRILVSANIRALFITSAAPAAQGRAWLETDKTHSRTARGQALLLRADGTAAYNGKLAEIRGRGNTTWWYEPKDGSAVENDAKRPYQIKLGKAADLLDTGDPAEANKRWQLLADYFDGTLLHNRVALDLARELGMNETPHCQPVDLYYDGEYRGLYLLTEKVEAGTGRVEVESAGSQARQNTAAITGGTAEAAGRGYLIELDMHDGKADQPSFTLSAGLTFLVHSPNDASDAMLAYVGGQMETLYAAIAAAGSRPDAGSGWTELLDVPSLLPYFWGNEWAMNTDTWRFSSTFYVLPPASRTFRMGPVWDFDLAFSRILQSGGSLSGPTGLTESLRTDSIVRGLLHIPAFQTLAARYYADVLKPVVTQILLGDESARGDVLHSLAWYWAEETQARRMNDVLWNPVSAIGRYAAPTYEENYEDLRAFIAERTAWLAQETARWLAPKALDTIRVTVSANYANTADTLHALAEPADADMYEVSETHTQESEATETAFARWRADLTAKPAPGYCVAAGARLLVNDTEIPWQKNADGSISASVRFEDPSYRPAVYGGVDYGLVFDRDFYRTAEPGASREELLADYVRSALPEGLAGNAFFDPQEIVRSLPNVNAMLGDDYAGVTYFFLDAGYADWMSWLGKTYRPTVLPAD